MFLENVKFAIFFNRKTEHVNTATRKFTRLNNIDQRTLYALNVKRHSQDQSFQNVIKFIDLLCIDGNK